jgi:hypothetical protein
MDVVALLLMLEWKGVLSHQLRRFTLDGEETILSREAHDQHVDVVKFEDYQAWTLDVIMSTGEGEAIEQQSSLFFLFVTVCVFVKENRSWLKRNPPFSREFQVRCLFVC